MTHCADDSRSNVFELFMNLGSTWIQDTYGFKIYSGLWCKGFDITWIQDQHGFIPEEFKSFLNLSWCIIMYQLSMWKAFSVSHFSHGMGSSHNTWFPFIAHISTGALSHQLFCTYRYIYTTVMFSMSSTSGSYCGIELSLDPEIRSYFIGVIWPIRWSGVGVRQSCAQRRKVIISLSR